jgi:hypothetical protein
METVNKYVHAASNAIWGEDGTANATQITQQHGEEPLSGVQGTGNATDPYDAGNRDGKYNCTYHKMPQLPGCLELYPATHSIQEHN